jgi:hypothetical protein
MREYKPVHRRLRQFLFEPSNAATILVKVPWENVSPGPVGEHVEVIDFDPASDCFYSPVDLDSPAVIALDGLPPAEGDPRFHQQTIYGLTMTTLAHFERGLGRRILWAGHRASDAAPETFVQRLRIYPHGLSGANACYSATKKALVMGYFANDDKVESAVSFTCLSRSVVAHETVHAILDGIRRLVHPSQGSLDELVAQEGVALAIGLLQPLTMDGFVDASVILTADLDHNNTLLRGLAQRIVEPAGQLTSLLGSPPDPNQSNQTPMAGFAAQSGALAACLFDAFLGITRIRLSRLFRVAGVRIHVDGVRDREEGPLHSNLLAAASSEARKSALHLLQMCIRAIDYSPPVDVNWEDYLRALITADADLAAGDEFGYRDAVVNAFRKRGMFPPGGGTAVVDLQWDAASPNLVLPVLDPGNVPIIDRSSEFERERAASIKLAAALKSWPAEMRSALGLSSSDVTVDSFRLARRAGPGGCVRADHVIRIVERKGQSLLPNGPEAAKGKGANVKNDKPDFFFGGGCTLIVDAHTLQVRYCISKDIRDADRLERYRTSQQKRISLFSDHEQEEKKLNDEPFSLLREALFETS